MTDRSIEPEVVITDDVESHRLAANDDETVVDGPGDVEGHRLASNDNETVTARADIAGEEDVPVDDSDVEGHRLAANDNETVVDD